MPEIVHWNPFRAEPLGGGPVTSRIPWKRRVNNFGDLLGPLIVNRVAAKLGLETNVNSGRRMLAVGSILRLAKDGDIVWGAGVNGKTLHRGQYATVDVRAVRGPKTAEVLRAQGISVPDAYGDPALLIPQLWSDEEIGIVRGGGGVVHVPNLNDLRSAPPGALTPRGDPWEKIRIIAGADLVIASSLHAIVLAESYGVPVVVVASPHEPPFKYEDYFLGTGRTLPEVASSWKSTHGIKPTPAISWSARALLEAFPNDLWG